MNDFPWLTTLILVPLVGAVVTAYLPSPQGSPLAKQVGVGFSLLAFIPALIVLFGFDRGADGFQYAETHSWIALFGAHYALGLDGLGLVMVLLTVVLIPIVMLASWHDADQHQTKAFFAWTLALEAMSLAVFTATDVFLFYVVFEATLIPAYFLIAGWGQEGRGRAATKFLLYQLAGGLIMLASVIGLYAVSAAAGTPSYLIGDLAQLNIDPTTAKWLFLGFFIAFAIKAPMFPVHTWLPDTTEKATTGTAVLLVCVLDKIGTFGMLRFCLGLFPEASKWATPAVIVLALISILYGAFVAIGQDNIFRLIGLTSLSHFGFIVLGIFVFSSAGISGAVLYMVNHGIGTALLFLVAGFLVKRRGTALLSEMGGTEAKAPVLAGIFLVAALAACGLPGLSTFVSEMMVLIAAFGHAWWTGALAVIAIVLAAIYALWMYQKAFTGFGFMPGSKEADEAAGQDRTYPDLNTREVATLAPLLVGLVLFGFYPMPVLNVINPFTEHTMSIVGTQDPAPSAPAATEGGHE